MKQWKYTILEVVENYYMGDLENGRGYKHGFPNALIIERDGRFTSNRLIHADQLLKEYNIKMISWDPSPPIKNKFISSKK